MNDMSIANQDRTVTSSVPRACLAISERRDRGELVSLDILRASDRRRIGSVTLRPDLTEAEHLAYARAFAAAPELLAALKRLKHIAVWDEDFDADDRAEFDAACADANDAIDLAERGFHPKYADVPRAEGGAQ